VIQTRHVPSSPSPAFPLEWGRGLRIQSVVVAATAWLWFGPSGRVADVIDLVAVEEADFEWMLGRGDSRHGLLLPPGGVDEPKTLSIVRRMNEALLKAHDRGAWMIVRDGEVVGLCSYIRPPADGEVEIGFGIAATRRNRGYASAAVAAVLQAAREDPLVAVVVARTATGNPASQRVLERNGFTQAGTDFDDEDGDVILWRRPVASP
jgi:RimJ/RimL family protein N-acetyltransferase